MAQNNAFIIDIDHTIIDTTALRVAIVALVNAYSPVTLEQLRAVIREILEKEGFYTWQSVMEVLLSASANKAGIIEAIVAGIYRLPFTTYYYPGVEDGLRKLTTLGEVYIYSQGEEKMQFAKMQPLLDKKLLDKDKFYVYKDKTANIPSFLANLSMSKKFVFDDHMSFLSAFSAVDPTIITVLIETQEDAASLTAEKPTIATKSFAEAVLKVEAML